MRLHLNRWSIPVLTLLIGMLGMSLTAQSNLDPVKIKEDLNQLIDNLANYYIYKADKQVDFDCLKVQYEKQITQLKTEEEVVLLYEYLLDEFYDSHLILNTNRQSSYRLSAPVYAHTDGEESRIVSVRGEVASQIDIPIIGAKILAINGIDFQKAIDLFPTKCSDKQIQEIRNWVGNKVLAGRYNESRILTLELKSGVKAQLDLDQLTLPNDQSLLSTQIREGIGIIKINNSLGNNKLIAAFDTVLDSLLGTKGLVLDLRNTVDGGNTYVARGIMGRFIDQDKPYQKHWMVEQYDDEGPVIRSWIELVSPRGKIYKNPMVVLVGRWTGSMGEGTAIGFDGMERAVIVGTEMERLAGSMYGFSFKHQNYGYRLSLEKLFHVNGTPREKFVPKHYIQQEKLNEDKALLYALDLIRNEAEK